MREEREAIYSEEQASDVVGLARGADEESYLLHEILHSCLGGKIGKITDEMEPALVGELLASGIEGLDDAIGEQNESIARLQLDGSSDKACFAENAERQAAGSRRSVPPLVRRTTGELWPAFT